MSKALWKSNKKRIVTFFSSWAFIISSVSSLETWLYHRNFWILVWVRLKLDVDHFFQHFRQCTLTILKEDRRVGNFLIFFCFQFPLLILHFRIWYDIEYFQKIIESLINFNIYSHSSLTNDMFVIWGEETQDIFSIWFGINLKRYTAIVRINGFRCVLLRNHISLIWTRTPHFHFTHTTDRTIPNSTRQTPNYLFFPDHRIQNNEVHSHRWKRVPKGAGRGDRPEPKHPRFVLWLIFFKLEIIQTPEGKTLTYMSASFGLEEQN